MGEKERQSFLKRLQNNKEPNPRNMTNQQMVDFYEAIDKQMKEELNKSIYSNDFDERYK